MSLNNQEAKVVLGMVARGDNEHDIAAWFGVNQGRIPEVKNGSHGSLTAASGDELAPKGSLGIKGRRVRAFCAKALEALEGDDIESAKKHLTDGLARFDRHEA